MDLAQLIRSRRTIHDFTAEPVDDGVVADALALAPWAPNHKVTMPIRFAWIGPVTRARVIEFAISLKGDASESKQRATREKMLGPAHLIAVARRRTDREKTRHEDYATLAAGLQNIALFLWERGVGTKWSTAAWATHPAAHALLGFAPDEVELEGCLMIGRPAVTPPAPVRPPLPDTLRRLP